MFAWEPDPKSFTGGIHVCDHDGVASVRWGPNDGLQKMNTVKVFDVVGEQCELTADVIVYVYASEGVWFACDFCI